MTNLRLMLIGGLLNGIEPVLSKKDMNGPTLDTSDNQFVYEENC
jgi:dTDP-4-dehydrorhamnose 3,5-epimerase